MEILKGTVTPVKFWLPTSDTTVSSATYAFNEGTPTNLSVSAPANGAVTANLPYQNKNGTVEVTWNFSIPGSGSFSESETYDVVTPLLPIREVKELLKGDPFNLPTDADAVAVESATRYIIQAHTGQRFEYLEGKTYSVRGNGSRALQLPQRLNTLGNVNEHDSQYFLVGDEGWTLRALPWGVPPVKADYYGLHMHVGGVIHNPNNVKLGFFADAYPYEVTGDWGWKQVPEQVKEAAKLLIVNYACQDSEYRDRYLTSMTAADWRIQFHSGAFRETGNVRADQLLRDYVLKSGWAVL